VPSSSSAGNVGRRSVLAAGGLVLAGGTLIAPPIAWAQPAERIRRIVAAKVELIVAVAPGAIRAAMQASNEVPIVMAWCGGPDLVEAGVIASHARPGGNGTSVDMLLSVLDAKRLDVLHQAVPKTSKVAVLIHGRQVFEAQMPALREVAKSLGIRL
jgi:putative tryptophan/tyrosine transport system substrate-binding protein